MLPGIGRLLERERYITIFMPQSTKTDADFGWVPSEEEMLSSSFLGPFCPVDIMGLTGVEALNFRLFSSLNFL